MVSDLSLNLRMLYCCRFSAYHAQGSSLPLSLGKDRLVGRGHDDRGGGSLSDSSQKGVFRVRPAAAAEKGHAAGEDKAAVREDQLLVCLAALVVARVFVEETHGIDPQVRQADILGHLDGILVDLR
jgi:hypothetical protein